MTQQHWAFASILLAKHKELADADGVISELFRSLSQVNVYRRNDNLKISVTVYMCLR